MLAVIAALLIQEALYVATPVTSPGEFTEGIEGPACDRDGNVYAVNFGKQQTIGRVTPDGVGDVFVVLPGTSTGNGIRIDPSGSLLVADYVGHNVLRIDPISRVVSVFAHEPSMNQPNDLALAADGTLYASDPNWDEETGKLWRIDVDGNAFLLTESMGTTNGLDLSPDGETLYVNESRQRTIWAFDVVPGGVANQRLLIQFPDHQMDGMRVDVEGRLYVTRYGKGTVAVVSPAGEVLREIDVLGARPSNICFCGPDGKTAYVTEKEHTRLVKFRVDAPGLTWSRLWGE